MAEEPAAEIQLLRSQKVKLIEILSADADFVLQHADSRGLVSRRGYRQVKSCRDPSEKVTDLLDHIIERGPEAAQELLELLKDQHLQDTFPKLCFINYLKINSPSSETSRKRKQDAELQDIIPAKNIRKNAPSLVTEKQLMSVARATDKSWRQIGIMALDIPSEKLDQIEEDHRQHVERVFAMLRCWKTRQRNKATAAHLHSLLSQEDSTLPPESIDFLLETN